MTMKRTGQNSTELLRAAVEAELARHKPLSAASALPAEKLLYELQVHQIQLEMQNEQLRQSQIELEKSRDRYVDFYDFAPDGYLTLNHEGMIDEINLTGAALIGVDRSKLPHRRFASFIVTEDRDRWHRHFLAVLKNDNKLSCELALQRGDGSRFYAQLDCLRLKKEGKEPVVRIVLTDITVRKQAEEQIRALAFYDTLTQLPNRRLLNDRLEQTMAASKRSGRYAALMFLDMDNFKPLNDAYGHDVGDLLLIEAAHRLTGCVREMDTVARFGGDEFMVMLGELAVDKTESATQAGIVAEKIRATLAEPYVLKIERDGKRETTIEHHCTSSIGVVLFINHEARTEEIIKWADMAMYQAKEAGGNLIRFYDSAGE